MAETIPISCVSECFAYQFVVTLVAIKLKHWRCPKSDRSRYSHVAEDVTRITEVIVFARLAIPPASNARPLAPDARGAGRACNEIGHTAGSEHSTRLTRLRRGARRIFRLLVLLGLNYLHHRLLESEMSCNLDRVISIRIWIKFWRVAYQFVVTLVAIKLKHWQSPKSDRSRYSHVAEDVTRITEVIVFARLAMHSRNRRSGALLH